MTFASGLAGSCSREVLHICGGALAYMLRTKAKAIYWSILVDKPATLGRSKSWMNIEITFSRLTV
jgi:hypothetical protein